MTEPHPSKEDLERNELELKVDILELELRGRQEKKPALGRGWEIAKTLLGFLGWIVAAVSILVSVKQFNAQQEAAFKQRVREQTEAALAKIQEDPLRLILYLQDYAEPATPILVEIIHTRHEEKDWPYRQLRALRSLRVISTNLSSGQLGLLREEARRGWRAHERWLSLRPADRPELKMFWMEEVMYRIYELVDIDESAEEDRKFKAYCESEKCGARF